MELNSNLSKKKGLSRIFEPIKKEVSKFNRTLSKKGFVVFALTNNLEENLTTSWLNVPFDEPHLKEFLSMMIVSGIYTAALQMGITPDELLEQISEHYNKVKQFEEELKNGEDDTGIA